MKTTLTNHIISMTKLIVYSALLLQIIYFSFLLITLKPTKSDFVSFYSATQIQVNQPENLYNLQSQQTYQQKFSPPKFLPFINPPLLLIPFLALNTLPTLITYRILILFNYILFILTCILITRYLKPPTNHQKILFLLTLSFAPVFITIFHTQSSIFTLFVFTLTYRSLSRKSWFLAGLIASFLFYKPQMGIILYIYLLLLNKKPILQGLITGNLIAVSISTIINPFWISKFIQTIPQFFSWSQSIGPQRITYLGFTNQLKYINIPPPPPSVAIIASLITIIIAVRLVKPVISIPKHLPLIYSIIIITTLVANIHSHYQEATLLILPLFLFLQHNKKISPKFYLTIATGWIIFLLAIINPFYPKPLIFLPTLYLIFILIVLLQQLRIARLTKNSIKKSSITTIT